MAPRSSAGLADLADLADLAGVPGRALQAGWWSLVDHSPPDVLRDPVRLLCLQVRDASAVSVLVTASGWCWAEGAPDGSAVVRTGSRQDLVHALEHWLETL